LDKFAQGRKENDKEWYDERKGKSEMIREQNGNSSTWNVAVIPATKPSVQNGGQLRSGRQHVRVSAYCRVSTGDESQQTSFTKQNEFYRELIAGKSNWSMAGIYADEAISGTSRKRRKQFNQMMVDAKEGKMDYIITKSISRFARNTVDTLECVRELQRQNPPVGIYFEKENIDTLDAKGELILTILSALAQEESRSLSDNIRWSFQKNFQKGKPHVNLKRMLGYDWDSEGNWIIDEEQAGIVRYIFEQYQNGWTPGHIAAKLNELGYTTVNKNSWRADGVSYILRNEKYVGDCEMQKYVSESFLNHRYQINNGQAPRYYVTDHHPGIISRELWKQVQNRLRMEKWERESRAESENKSGGGVFSNLKCNCGGTYINTVYHRKIRENMDERIIKLQKADRTEEQGEFYYTYSIWKCGRKYADHQRRGRLTAQEQKRAEEACNSPILYETAVKQAFMELLYQMKYDYEQNGGEADFVKKFAQAQKYSGRTGEERTVMKQNFERFLQCIMELPNTKCLEPEEGDAPELFLFEKNIYRAFIREGIVEGDIIRYQTVFGTEAVCSGNSRTLSFFVGYKRKNADGSFEKIEKIYQVSGRTIGWRRKRRN
jgi:DNA invertase Pin-like site-specific DNA recombinase